MGILPFSGPLLPGPVGFPNGFVQGDSVGLLTAAGGVVAIKWPMEVRIVQTSMQCGPAVTGAQHGGLGFFWPRKKN